MAPKEQAKAGEGMKTGTGYVLWVMRQLLKQRQVVILTGSRPKVYRQALSYDYGA